MSLVAPPPVPGTTTLLGEPIARFFDHVRLLEKDRPLDNRFVAFNCNESYHVFPNGHQRHVMLVNCGNGRSDCANVLLSG